MGRVGSQQQAGHDRDGDAGTAGTFDGGDVDLGVPEELRSCEGGACGLLGEETFDLLSRYGSDCGVTRRERGDGDGQRLEGGA